MTRNAPFQSVLEALLDDSRPFPRAYYPRFSDILPGDLKAVLAIWPKVSNKRRLSLLGELKALAEDDTLLSFDDFARALLDDSDGQVRAAAVRLLWECEDAKLVPLFARMLAKDPDPAARAAAAAGLGLFVQSGEFEDIPERLLHQVEDALLAAATGSDESPIRRRALESLGFSSRLEIPALIEAAFARSDPEWVVSALFAMGRSSDERWQDQVLAGITNDNMRIRAAAVEAAGELAMRSARPILLNLLAEEEESEVVQAAIWSLSQIGGEDVRAVLINLLDQAENEEIAGFLEEALENLDFTEELEHFDLMSLDTDDEPEE